LTIMMGAGLIGPLAIAWLSDRTGKRTSITQITFLNLVLYGSVVQAHGALT